MPEKVSFVAVVGRTYVIVMMMMMVTVLMIPRKRTSNLLCLYL